jgi:prepilin-type N-terminal cleavage/methylation domain-containing protein
MKKMKRTLAARGFTLIEIAIVLAVLGLLIGGGVVAAGSLAQQGRVGTTKERIAVVEKALLAYVIQNACLPCPANPAGTAAFQDSATPATACETGCNRVSGVVPWGTLGLTEEDAADAWGKRLGYGMPAELHSVNAMVRSTSTMPSVTDANELVIEDLAGNVVIGGTTVPADLAYVVLSHGQDGAFAYGVGGTTEGADKFGQNGTGVGQDENRVSVSANLNYADGPVNGSNSSAHFDDIVAYRSARNIILACGAGSCGNPS